MEEMRYTISDAAKMVKVESHVLRYWEDELSLDIPRNEMGHRYYTQREIDVFCHIRALKDRGFQLKAIKDVLEIMFLEEKENNIISLDNVRQGYEDNENEARKKDDVKAAETATAELAEVKKAEVPAAAGISAGRKNEPLQIHNGWYCGSGASGKQSETGRGHNTAGYRPASE